VAKGHRKGLQPAASKSRSPRADALQTASAGKNVQVISIVLDEDDEVEVVLCVVCVVMMLMLMCMCVATRQQPIATRFLKIFKLTLMT